jgi:glycine/D-amino acid oxidase-like deaminating enzyme
LTELPLYKHHQIQHSDYVYVTELKSEENDDVGILVSNDGDQGVISCLPHQGSIMAAIFNDSIEKDSLTIAEAVNDTVGRYKAGAHAFAREHLRSFDENAFKQGQSYISTATDTGLPIIDKIPACEVDDRCSGENESPLGIWLCYGFGRYGTTPAPDVARAMRMNICGEDDAQAILRGTYE